MNTPNNDDELTPEEEAELSELLTDYMTDGKLDFAKIQANSKPFDLDAAIAAEKARNTDS